jgi:hypothetical protein
VSAGLFFPFSIVVLLVILHRVHMFLFSGCLLSRLQKSVGALPSNQNFLQFAAKRLFKKDISVMQSQVLDYSFVGCALLLALLRTNR